MKRARGQVRLPTRSGVESSLHKCRKCNECLPGPASLAELFDWPCMPASVLGGDELKRLHALFHGD
eukprot:10137509-Alexandrium_andersonii.AAC.1